MEIKQITAKLPDVLINLTRAEANDIVKYLGPLSSGVIGDTLYNIFEKLDDMGYK